MAKKTETALTPAEALRKGWLAYIGLYGVAFERAKPYGEKAMDAFETLVAKGETVEGHAQDVVESVRERANDAAGPRFERIRKFIPTLPTPVSNKARVEELEAEIEALNKKVASLTKKPAAKRSTKKAA
ncbi:MAG: hypothetical protein AAFW81_06165 [Pseudomonadota bacterium]